MLCNIFTTAFQRVLAGLVPAFQRDLTGLHDNVLINFI